MIIRCYDKNSPVYNTYGARGIEVDKVWIRDFEQFYKDVEKDWFDGSELDRINPYGNYTKENCQWISKIKNLSKIKRQKVYCCDDQSGLVKTVSFRLSELDHQKFFNYLDKKNLRISSFMRKIIKELPGDNSVDCNTVL